MLMDKDRVLNIIYYGEHNYVGVNELYRLVKKRKYDISKEYIKTWLGKQESHVVQKKEVGKIQYLPIYSDTPYSFQIDLTFFPRYKKANNGYYVLFTAININTRYVYAYMAKDKSMETIMKIVREMEKKTVINSFTSDYGGEFYNKEFRDFCRDNKIINYFILDDSHKLGIINRFHRTLKERLTKYFIAKKTTKWIDVIDQIVDRYNHTFNRGIGATPFEVENDKMLEMIILNQKKEVTGVVKKTKPEFEIGDKVVLKRKKVAFEDKMLSKYHTKKHVVVGVSANSLKIVDAKGNEQKVKKSTALKVNDAVISDNTVNNGVEQVTRENTRRNVALRNEVDPNLIIHHKRRKEPEVSYEPNYFENPFKDQLGTNDYPYWLPPV